MPTIAIIGRPNAGKSTLFNALIGERRAIESDTPGTTRDRVFGVRHGEIYDLFFVDTGGLTTEIASDIEADMRAQAEQSIAGADLIYFCIDARSEVTAEEWQIAEILRKNKPKNIPVFLVATKAEKPSVSESAGELYALGVTEHELFFVSAKEHMGVPALLQATEAEFKKRGYQPKASPEESPYESRIAIVGRPNAGKSTLLNVLAGKKVAIVSEVAGTTRDNIDAIVAYEKEQYLLIDTAGVRKKSRMNREQIERFSRMRALSALARADVAVLLVSTEEGISHQDQALASELIDAGVGVMVVFSKWDLARQQVRTTVETEIFEKDQFAVEKTSPEEIEKEISKAVAKLRERFLREAQVKFPFLSWAPVLFLSSVEKRGIHEIFATAKNITAERKRRIGTSELNQFLEQALQLHPPAGKGTKRLKVKYVTQGESDPPQFLFFANDPDAVHFSFRRFLENRLREVYGFWGTPIRIEVRKK